MGPASQPTRAAIRRYFTSPLSNSVLPAPWVFPVFVLLVFSNMLLAGGQGLGLRSKNDSRKFIDVIFRASGCYANMSPSHIFQVGDYGSVDTASGIFLKEGNIYADNFEQRYGIVIGSPVTRAVSERLFYASRDASRRDEKTAVGS
jgi:hypothetical protein